MSNAILQTDVASLEKYKQGKVRDIYDLGDQLLITATDRISAFDSVMPNPIPDKGALLTGITAFWFDTMNDIMPNHFITTDLSDLNLTDEERNVLQGRSMLVKKTEVMPVECVVRGYIAGSGWREYCEKGTACGIQLPENLLQCGKLPEPIFTPATKADDGHDENIPFKKMVDIVGKETAEYLREKSIEIYKKAADYAIGKNIIIADTKFEFGKLGDEIVLIDEILTPDSSRFWPADCYEAGRDQESFDKQFLRNYLEESGWDKEPPAPELPDKIVNGTREKYVSAFEQLTGKTF
mgnify:CR=1 FL=1